MHTHRETVSHTYLMKMCQFDVGFQNVRSISRERERERVSDAHHEVIHCIKQMDEWRKWIFKGPTVRKIALS